MIKTDAQQPKRMASPVAGDRRWPGLRAAGWCGVIGPVLFTATFLGLEQVRREDFDPLVLPVSALEAGPFGWVQQISFVVFGVLTGIFAAGLHRGIRPSRLGFVGPALLAASGAALIGAGVFPLRADAGEIYVPAGHRIAGLLFFSTSALALVFLSRRLKRDPAWSALAGWVLGAGLVCAAGFVVTGTLVMPEGAPLHDWAGLVQRAVILAALFPARVALGLRLITLAGRQAAAPPLGPRPR